MTTPAFKLKPKEQNEDDLSFAEWARLKYKEVSKLINPCDERGQLDPQRLNQVLTVFSQHFAWAITYQEIESNSFNLLNHQYKSWWDKAYAEAYRTLRDEAAGAGRAPAQVAVEARIEQLYGEQKLGLLQALEEARSRVDLLKGLVKVLDRQASILQTLSSNMRSELFFAAGVPIDGSITAEQKRKAANVLVREAMAGQGKESQQ